MARSSVIRCHDCDFIQSYLSGLVVLTYHLPDGTTAEWHREKCWCGTCQRVMDVEAPLVIEELQKKLNALTSRAAREDSREAKDAQNLIRLLRVAKIRTSSPRCLTCGGQDLKSLVFDADGNCTSVTHSCDGVLYKVPPNPNGIVFNERRRSISLNVEGKVLREE